MIPPSDKELLRSLALGSLTEPQKEFVAQLLKNSEEARREYRLMQALYSIDNEREELLKRIEDITKEGFSELEQDVFLYQSRRNSVFQQYLKLSHYGQGTKGDSFQIRFLPIELFKTDLIQTGNWEAQKVFLSSGTTGMIRSQHAVRSLQYYHMNCLSIFNDLVMPVINPERKPLQWLGLLPGYLENPHSSLISMVYALSTMLDHSSEAMITSDGQRVMEALRSGQKDSFLTILFGVSFALVDLAQSIGTYTGKICIVETGGMKTDRRNMQKSEILNIIKTAFPNAQVISEYGMTELTSQAYSTDGRWYQMPPKMKVRITATDDPWLVLPPGRRGRINITDLGNLDTCSFIQTGDAGIVDENGRLEVLGRLQDEELRGCNLMYNG
ncbi:MAG: hypothetical protein K1X68_08950 [Saprospiraceae bacterium]|nr:hypothetical protein [Saprospiraceae bacterium]HMW38353.1 hypothetical protein [Saprospiraceae bacterium]HMX87896.1 hypothetical protein [Saprospiraceae bacterium]HMZ39744.1 hypothetical protein [Saprospiraceae bacterium]HNA63384.1 hypothetical protein [Saprospiraceae bacterium]